MDAQSITTLMISVFSLLFSILAIVTSYRSAKTDRINTNTWETYSTWNSEDIKRGRKVARVLAKDPAWKNVRDYAAYQAYFKVDEPTGRGQDEQDLHYLIGFYHQIGILLDRKLMDEDFTMFLLGEGLADRWPVLGRIPEFYPNHPYKGMYSLYERYLKWNEEKFPRLIHKSVEARQKLLADDSEGRYERV